MSADVSTDAAADGPLTDGVVPDSAGTETTKRIGRFVPDRSDGGIASR